MAMLVIMVSISAPALARFFRGRTLDAEAKRFLALTRYGQSRAVSEGVPAVLWIDAKEGAYGLRADSSYVEQDTKALEYRLHEDIQVEIEFTVVTQRLTTVWRGTSGLAANVPRIRFLPDGFVGQNSPARVVFRQGEDGEISIGPGRNGLNYEIETNQVERLRR
jgi:Tfp pilus assembly protein FimT